VAKPQSFAAVSLRAEGSSRWLRVDAVSGKLDQPDALPLPLKTTSCVVKGVDPKATYVARVRLGNQSGWGPDSPARKSLTLASLLPTAPSAPAAPLLEAVDKTSLRVHFSPPPVRPGAPAHESVTVHVKAGDGAWQAVDATSSTLISSNGSGTAHWADSRVALVKGLAEGLSYRAQVNVKNACGWGAFSPVSEPLTLGAAAFKPIASAAPLLEAVDSTSLRVHFSPPPVRPGAPAHESVTVYVGVGGAWQTVDAASSTLKPGVAFRAGVGFALVKGLSEGVTYRAKVSVRNIHGWGAHSPSSEPLQLPEPASPVSGPASSVSGPVSGPASPEVEVTGSKSREERDAELRKRSVDVDAEVVDLDAPRYPKRSKKES
ncbi:hypothetical protein EMIHUDRAFT_368284, partial [Emiliania huxleyi CCMP1516]|uniref:Fibronectin type-III domain-containing protein n=2 Tax=Emiliania huxleyi TaxID=2903 RepID=A0A0D3JGM0_EMIH1